MERVGRVDDSLSSILDGMGTISNLATTIAASTEQQTSVSQEISRNISNVADSSGDMVEDFSALSGSIASLQSASEQMQSSIGRFKV